MRGPAWLTATALAVASVACTVGETRYEKLYLPVRDEPTEGPAVCATDDWVQPDLTRLTVCGQGKGHCYGAKKSALGGGFAKDTCKADGEVCYPDAVLAAGGKKLKKCAAIIGNGGGCIVLDLVPEMRERGKGLLKQDACDDGEVCAPCINPEADNASTTFCEPQGVHDRDCRGGPATEATEVCCHGMGSCLSRDGVPADARDDLTGQECSENKLCAPAAMVSNKPVKCEVAGFDGVCMDTCFAEVLQGAEGLLRASCQVTERCIPCAVAAGRGMPGCE